MIDYACEIIEEHEEDKPLADELAKYAKFRLEHFAEFHKLFVEEARKHKEVNEKTVEHCIAVNAVFEHHVLAAFLCELIAEILEFIEVNLRTQIVLCVVRSVLNHVLCTGRINDLLLFHFTVGNTTAVISFIPAVALIEAEATSENRPDHNDYE
jgi:hypothetical protein